MKEIKEKLKNNDLFQAVLDSSRTGVISIAADTYEKYYQDENFQIPEDANGNAILPEGKEWTKEGYSAVDLSSLWFPNLNNDEGRQTFLESLKTWLKEDFEDYATDEQKNKLQEIADTLIIKNYALVYELISDIVQLKMNYKDKKSIMDDSWIEVKKVLLSDKNTLFSAELKSILENLNKDKDSEWYIWEVCPIKKDWSSWVWVVDTIHAAKVEMASNLQLRSKGFDKNKYENDIKNISVEEVREKLSKDGYISIGPLWVSSHDPTVMVSEIAEDLKDGYSKEKLAEVINLWLKTVAEVSHSAEYVEE